MKGNADDLSRLAKKVLLHVVECLVPVLLSLSRSLKLHVAFRSMSAPLTLGERNSFVP